MGVIAVSHGVVVVAFSDVGVGCFVVVAFSDVQQLFWRRAVWWPTRVVGCREG